MPRLRNLGGGFAALCPFVVADPPGDEQGALKAACAPSATGSEIAGNFQFDVVFIALNLILKV